MEATAKYYVTIYLKDGEKHHVGPFTKDQIYAKVLPEAKKKKDCIAIFEDVNNDLQDRSYHFGV